jgi:hypothetical protein
MNKTIFKGTCTAAITPFTQDGVDYDALGKQIEYQIENGIDALYDDIAIDNASVKMFFKCGFREVLRTEEYVLVKKEIS